LLELKEKDAYDVVFAPFKATDYLLIKIKENTHCFKIKEVTGEPGQRREVVCRRIASTDPNLTTEAQLTFHPGQPVMGKVIPEHEFSLGEEEFLDSAGAANKLIVVELTRFLQGLTHAGNQAPYKACVEFLVKSNLLPKRDYRQNKQHLSKLLAANRDRFSVPGSYIKIKEDFAAPKGFTNDPSQEYVPINLYHLNQMVYHGLMSGLFTGGRPVRLVDVDLQVKT